MSELTFKGMVIANNSMYILTKEKGALVFPKDEKKYRLDIKIYEIQKAGK